ncbi:ANTAR domain-containing protein [Algiphilus sp.]|uniref:ANTAR domain-containing response regulator n=1 Tax=Algiphilus sp. TaxID=1872431 RepID=UPI0025C6ACF3|nr:ANTAR domain-containing protein [Algiphilus sp.]MCK5770993.1 ANTAR domain-containing protein [Algiphilus sp.]
MRIMLVDDDPERCASIEASLRELGHEIVAMAPTDANLLDAVERRQPDVILIDVDAPGRDTLESLRQVHRNLPRPIVLFAESCEPATIRQAVRAGVTSYVVDGMSPARLKPILDVAIARFEEFEALKRELEDTKLKLADRRDVEKAKGLLMKRRGLDEDTAYSQLRRLAMTRNLKMGDAARAIISAAELL